jgi:hypothetical protein
MVSFLVVCAHLVGDFIVQSGSMAEKKREDPIVRAAHVLSYSIVMYLVTLYLFPVQVATTFTVLQAVVHYGIDSRTWLEGRGNFEEYPFVVDQILHLTSLAVLLHAIYEFPAFFGLG